MRGRNINRLTGSASGVGRLILSSWWSLFADVAELFFVAADFGGEGFEGGAELVDLDGEAGESQCFPVALAVFLDEAITVATIVGLTLIVGGSWLAAGGFSVAVAGEPSARHPAEVPIGDHAS